MSLPRRAGRLPLFTLLIATAAALVGCGQKGPLFAPVTATATRAEADTPGQEAAAPAAEDDPQDAEAGAAATAD